MNNSCEFKTTLGNQKQLISFYMSVNRSHDRCLCLPQSLDFLRLSVLNKYLVVKYIHVDIPLKVCYKREYNKTQQQRGKHK